MAIAAASAAAAMTIELRDDIMVWVSLGWSWTRRAYRAPLFARGRPPERRADRFQLALQGDRAPLWKNFRGWILRYVCNAAARQEEFSQSIRLTEPQSLNVASPYESAGLRLLSGAVRPFVGPIWKGSSGGHLPIDRHERTEAMRYLPAPQADASVPPISPPLCVRARAPRPTTAYVGALRPGSAVRVAHQATLRTAAR
jgi:hypothetical protein